MQNRSDNGDKLRLLYTEEVLASGFVLREMHTVDGWLKYQAGSHVMRPMEVPVYKSNCVIRYDKAEPVQVFCLEGFGATRDAAIMAASNKRFRADLRGPQEAVA